MTTRRTTRKIKVGNAFIGGDAPVLIQTMAATKTFDVDATVATVDYLAQSGAGLVRIAVDSINDAKALAEIRKRTTANLSVDLQENFRLAELVAPNVDKIRYNPGHLHHLEPNLAWEKKVEYLVDVAKEFDVALRVGVNCGSLDPTKLAKYRDQLANGDAGAQENDDAAAVFDPLLESALEHVDFLDSVGFTRYCVSIKDSDPETVVLVNRRFAALRPQIPLHLGVTEAGAPPRGVLKSRLALETLLAEGIGETLRVSLTVEANQKAKEVEAGRLILENVASGNVIDPSTRLPNLNIVSCPSCSRVQNGRFVELARTLEKATEFAKDYPFKIATMGCRVNGPGETDDADVGLWCGADKVNLKSGSTTIGSFGYDEIIEKAVELLQEKIRLYDQQAK
ncbi:MAG: flavodoxin-dependent (E)-4-hydroxy-3-methylbut-2-enyl-diphosphate synthase [Thermoguttaceae bacterium]|nr:flavodoxin-dependent (E)-4-hydroxy-3-methylbut-2-enyl-diphosphate synthase [Thermoguttaceae bacterium]